MIPILCQWFIASFTAIGIGSLFSNLPYRENHKIGFDLLTILIGFATISWIACIWSLFLPLNRHLLLCLLLIATVGFSIRLLKISEARFMSHFSQKKRWIQMLAFLAISCISLVFASGLTENSDHFEYYLPTVKWMENFPVVPGSALFNHRIGNNSNFHLLSATFSLHDIRWGGTYTLNSLLFILFYSYFLSNIPGLLKKYKQSNILSVCATFFPFTFLLDSMDVDYLTIMGGVFILIQCLKLAEEKATRNQQITSVFLIILFMTTVRVLSILYLLPLLLVSWRQLDKKNCVMISVVGLTYLTPWLIRNYYISGYLVFPIYYLDLFSTEWKTPLHVAKASYGIITEFAKVSIIRDGYLYDGMREWPLIEWLPIWVKNQSSILIGIFAIVGIPIAFLASIYNYIKTRTTSSHILGLNFIFYFVIAFWFLNFPSIRFIWPWILAFIIINGFTFTHHYNKVLNQIFCYIVITLALIGFGTVLKKTYNALHSNGDRAITFKHQQEMLENIAILRSRNAQCGDLNPPCLPQENNLKIIPLGDEIEDGFKIRD